MSEQSKLEQEIDRRAHAFADLSVGINGKNDTEDQKRLYWFGVRHGYSNGFSDAAEMHQHLMAEKEKRIERLREALGRVSEAYPEGLANNGYFNTIGDMARAALQEQQ